MGCTIKTCSVEYFSISILEIHHIKGIFTRLDHGRLWIRQGVYRCCDCVFNVISFGTFIPRVGLSSNPTTVEWWTRRIIASDISCSNHGNVALLLKLIFDPGVVSRQYHGRLELWSLAVFRVVVYTGKWTQLASKLAQGRGRIPPDLTIIRLLAHFLRSGCSKMRLQYPDVAGELNKRSSTLPIASALDKATDVAGNRPLWILMFTFGATRSKWPCMSEMNEWMNEWTLNISLKSLLE